MMDTLWTGPILWARSECSLVEIIGYSFLAIFAVVYPIGCYPSFYFDFCNELLLVMFFYLRWLFYFLFSHTVVPLTPHITPVAFIVLDYCFILSVHLTYFGN